MHLRSHEITSARSSNLLIIISHSARALAESASRAGWDIITVDGFADIDTLKASKCSWCLPLASASFLDGHIYTCLSRLKVKYPAAGVLLGAGAEFLAAWVEQETDWVIYGNSASVMESVNEPKQFFSGLDRIGVDFPRTEIAKLPNDAKTDRWLYKFSQSCGGCGVSRVLVADENDGYWQENIDGDSISVLYLAGKSKSRLIGANKMLSKDFGEQMPYVYLGAVANYKIDKSIIEKIESYSNKIINHFSLVGVISIDMIIAKHGDEEKIYVLEVNPRISASFELYERIYPDLNLVDEHIGVCEGEADSSMTLTNTVLTSSVSAYRIVYADKAGVISESGWPDWCKDIPELGRQISCGEPICSVYADEHEGDMYLLLQEREKTILSNKINYL